MGVFERKIYKMLTTRTPSVIGTDSEFAIGVQLGAAGVTPASATWPLANEAIYIPFFVPEQITITRVGLANGSAVSGNLDMGIYSSAPGTGLPATRLGSLGSTAQATANALQPINFTDLVLAPARYFMAVVLDNTTGTNMAWTIANQRLRLWGIFREDAAFPLPATATPVTASITYIPSICISRTDEL